MKVSEAAASLDAREAGDGMLAFLEDLFPLCRSITGAGLRETLHRIGARIPLELHEVPTGTPAFDWTVPREWNIAGGWLANPAGRRVVDFADSNLRVVSYSVPVRARLSLDELRPHLHTIPDHPTWVPYRTAYYSEAWGFCLSQEELDRLPEGEYEAVIDSTLTDGSLTYGECVLPGRSSAEVLVSSHCCHPSLANDNLSGVVVAVALAEALTRCERRLTYRFVFAPGTIGALVWLSRNPEARARIRAGLVLATVGDAGPLVYKRSRRGSTEIDRAAEHVLAHRAGSSDVEDFSPYGNDERQYCSPGIDLAVGALSRSGHDRSLRHHTSADDVASLDPAALGDTLAAALEICAVLEDDAIATNLSPMGEPQLGRRGLYRAFGGRTERALVEQAVLWVLSMGDGRATLVDVAVRSRLPFAAVREAATALEGVGLLQLDPVWEEGAS